VKQHSYSALTDELLIRAEPNDFDLYFGIEPTQDELERHAKLIPIGSELLRNAAWHGDYKRLLHDAVMDRVEWQAWAITCERAMNSPEPGWDANGAPV